MSSLIQQLGSTPITVALIALAGVGVSALVGLFASSRSKYVEVIAAERIKWVGEIREDVRLFLAACDAFPAWREERKVDKNLRWKQNSEANLRATILALKLNASDFEDLVILRTLGKVEHAAVSESEEIYIRYRDYLGLLVNFKLKDEWEKAKCEAAGPLRWCWLKFRHWNVKRKRKEQIIRSIPADILARLESPLSADERFLPPELPNE